MVKSNKLHFFGFITVFTGLVLLSAYQLFVTPQFTHVPFKQFFKSSTFSLLFYQPEDIGQPENFPSPNPLTVDCRAACQFTFNDQTFKALIDNDPQAKITSLDLKFFDSSAGLIGYQISSNDNPTFYVINLDNQLLQTIRLNLNQHRLLEFINYYPKTAEVMFKSTHQQTQETEHWLYQATKPSLRQINL